MAQGAQTADRALDLLLRVVESDEPLTLAELGSLAGLNKAVTYRLVQTLVERSLLDREPDGRHYRVGAGLVALAGTVLRKLSIREAAGPVMRRIAAATSETVTLHVRSRRHHVCVEVVEGRMPIRRVVPIGETVSLLDGTASKAMLPWLPERDLEQILGWAEEEGRNVARLRAQIEQSRADGYYAAVSDRLAGAGALSVPIFDLNGVKGSLTVSGPGDRFSEAVMAEAAPLVRAECRALSEALGHVFEPEGLEPASVDGVAAAAAA